MWGPVLREPNGVLDGEGESQCRPPDTQANDGGQDDLSAVRPVMSRTVRTSHAYRQSSLVQTRTCFCGDGLQFQMIVFCHFLLYAYDVLHGILPTVCLVLLSGAECVVDLCGTRGGCGGLPSTTLSSRSCCRFKFLPSKWYDLVNDALVHRVCMLYIYTSSTSFCYLYFVLARSQAHQAHDLRFGPAKRAGARRGGPGA